MLKAEAGAKNKWRWEWLEETSIEGIAISTWCKKLDLAGTCCRSSVHQYIMPDKVKDINCELFCQCIEEIKKLSALISFH